MYHDIPPEWVDSEELMWVECNNYIVNPFKDIKFLDRRGLVNYLKDMDIYFYNKDRSIHAISFLAWTTIESLAKQLKRCTCELPL